jgi:hypothetical protein
LKIFGTHFFLGWYSLLCTPKITNMLQKAIVLLEEGHIETARKLISHLLSEECIGLIISKTSICNRNEALSIYYEALLLFCDQITNKKFTYKDEPQCKGYIKKNCFNKAMEYDRLIKGSKFLVSSEVLENYEEEFVDFYEELRTTEYEKKKQAGIEISIQKLMDTFPIAVIDAFHTLKEKCKLLIILKYKMNLKHDEVINILLPFYKIKNKDVSKVELQRCLNSLKEEVKQRVANN